ncbi:MAG: cytosolic protein [Candidatus Parabeggiatoa sp. nov. 1]|nr:MAG: cytosolic protein [Gammaproteobacteria bacterium]
MTKASTELDNPWQDIIEPYFEAFIAFFFPQAHKQIDWNRGYDFLEQERQPSVKYANMELQDTDNLVKIGLTNGTEAVLHIYTKVQGQKDERFTERMFIYHYQLVESLGQRVISLAILGDKDFNWRPKNYGYQLMGCELSFRFPIVKLIDYKNKWGKLEKSDNPFAIVVRAHLKSIETSNTSKKRLKEKEVLFKALYETNYSDKEFLDLFRFIDWVLDLPKELEQQFFDFAKQYEQEKEMSYITSIERLAREQAHEEGIQLGVLQNSRENVVDILKIRFTRVPKPLVNMIKAIDDTKLLSTLLKEAILVDSLKVFKQQLEPQK